MSDRNRQVLCEILQKDGNSLCADCKTNENVEWASCSLGIFLCQDCASMHRSLGVDISRIKSIKLDFWDDDHVKKMAEFGNDVVNEKYEQHLPKYYRRPTKNDKEILRMQFIRAKYERKEFVYPDRQSPYSCNTKEGELLKKGKDKKNYNPRKFIINSLENCIQYFNKAQPKGPKGVIALDDVNVVLAPDKIGIANSMQITYLKNGNTRNIFVYCHDAKEVINWYMAIRCAKLERRRLAFPDRNEDELCKDLLTDFRCEGYLEKKGPSGEAYRKRWFTLDRRKLMYLETPLSATPKGDAYIGHSDSGYSLDNGPGDLEFFLHTGDRHKGGYQLKADNFEDKDRWMTALQAVISTPQTPQDIRLYHAMVVRR